MIVVSGCQGSGSSFLIWCAKHAGWRVCKRPDKPGVDRDEIYRDRMSAWGGPTGWRDMADRERAVATVTHLRKHKHGDRTLLLSASWGHQGHLQDIPTVYLIRHPVHAYVSFLGGGWLSINRKNMGAARSPNDTVLIENWLYGRNRWIGGVMHAMDAHARQKGHIVRYHRLPDDWDNVPGPKFGVRKHYAGCNDDWERTRGFLAEKTIQAIMDKAGTVWREVLRV